MKLSFILLLIFAVAKIYATPVINGREAKINEFNFIVSFKSFGKINDFGHFCGGSIINKHWVVTAAHCFLDWRKIPIKIPVDEEQIKKDVVIHLGSHQLRPHEEYHIDRVVIHPYYIKHTYTNDIALVRVKKTIKFSNKVSKIEVPNQKLVDLGDEVTMAGWGYTTNDVAQPMWLQVLEKSKVVSNSECDYEWPRFQERTLCTLSPDETGPCNTDSGGPTIVKINGTNYLVGIISNTIVDEDKNKCAVGNPEAHTNVYFYKNWILSTMAKPVTEL